MSFPERKNNSLSNIFSNPDVKGIREDPIDFI